MTRSYVLLLVCDAAMGALVTTVAGFNVTQWQFYALCAPLWIAHLVE